MFEWLLGKDDSGLTSDEKQKILQIYDYELKYADSDKVVVDRIAKFLTIE